MTSMDLPNITRGFRVHSSRLLVLGLHLWCFLGLAPGAHFSNITHTHDQAQGVLPAPVPRMPVEYYSASKGIKGKAACPCEDASLCETIKTAREKEIYVFSVSKDDWLHYDWSHVTTIVMFNYYDPALMCYAHSKDVRVVSLGQFQRTLLDNLSDQVQWVMDRVNEAIDQHLDGINLDIEFVLDAKDAHLLTSLVQMTTKTFRDSIPGSQVTFDVPWSSDCIDQRCYDMKGIADAVDFVYIMAYDEQSQIFGDCIAMANSPYNKTAQGVEAFLKLGIPASKLVLGVPWYGYNYPCLNLSYTDVCSIDHVPFRGVNCSDAAGKQIDYSLVMKLLAVNSTGRKWNKQYKAPYFTYKDEETGNVTEVWYDDPVSLKLRYDYAKKMGLRGVGPWNADTLDYSNDPVAKQQTKAMWDAMASFLSS